MCFAIPVVTREGINIRQVMEQYDGMTNFQSVVPCTRTIKHFICASCKLTSDVVGNDRPRIARSVENIAAVVGDVKEIHKKIQRYTQLGRHRRSLQQILAKDLKNANCL